MNKLYLVAGLFLAALLFTGCASDPEARVETKTVYIPTPVPCTVDLKPDPKYPDTREAILMAKDIFERAKLYAAGRKLRIARAEELKAALSACGAHQ